MLPSFSQLKNIMCLWLSLQTFGLQTQPSRAASGKKAQHIPLLTSSDFGRKRTELDPLVCPEQTSQLQKGWRKSTLLAQGTLTIIFQLQESATSASNACGTLRDCFLPSPAWLLPGSPSDELSLHLYSRRQGAGKGRGTRKEKDWQMFAEQLCQVTLTAAS